MPTHVSHQARLADASSPSHARFSLQGFILHLQALWRKRQNERALEGLPSEIRKDIGWPTPAGKAGNRR